MKTKEQEQKALDQIKKILADFGPDTYLGIAFEGVLEDAQENIDNDWGCSMKQRYKKAFEDGEEAAKEAEQAKKELEDLRPKVLPSEVMVAILSTVYEYQAVLEEKAEVEAQNIVNFADDTTQPAFTQAVRCHRVYLRRIQEQEDIISAVVHTEQ